MSDGNRVDLANVGPGLAWAYAFDDDGVGRVLPADQPVDLLGSSGFVWAHLILANARTRDWIAGHPLIPEEARDVLLSSAGHPRLDWGGDAMWGVFFDVERELDKVLDEPTDLRFVLRPQFLITARHHPVQAASDMKAKVDQQVAFADSVTLFERLLVSSADSVGAAAHRIAVEIDQIEDHVLSDSVSDETGRLLKLRRAISKQERLAQAAQSVLGQLEQHRSEHVLQVYRELGQRVRQRVASFHADLHLQAERARLLQEETAAQLATATNRNLFVLTVVTTFLLPPALVTGFFGMNTKNLPFSESDYGSLYASILCVLAGLFVYFLIRRYKMLG